MALVLASGQGPLLVPGSPAPPLSIREWVKGRRIQQMSPRGIYVVEFWATWCPPCIDLIPKLTEKAKKNRDVTFIGVSIWEDNDNKAVQNFVRKMGSKMDYNVGWSGNQEGMAQTWVGAAGGTYIPYAFIVKDRTIQWIGHPEGLAQPLAAIKKGSWDVNMAAAAYRTQIGSELAETKGGESLQRARDLAERGSISEARTLLAKIKGEFPDSKFIQSQAEVLEKFVLGQVDQKAFIMEVRSAQTTDQRETLAMAAMDLVGPARTRDLAVQAAELLMAGPESLGVINAAMNIYMAAGLEEKSKEAAQRGVRFMSSRRKPGDSELFEMFRSVAKG